MVATGFRLTVMVVVAILAGAAAADGYTNHTVGGAAGWFFYSSTNKASADYNAWAANQTFNLGDILIFNTSTNQTVIQTYNATTYNSCTTDDALDTDTFQYDGGSDQFNDAITILVPLTIEGLQYYFSDANAGEQCRNGMAFEIKVNRGLGLPPSLNQPPPPPYAAPPEGADAGLPPPIVVVGTPTNKGISAGASPSFFCSLLVLLAFSFWTGGQ